MDRMETKAQPLTVLQVVISLRTGGLERLVLDMARLAPGAGLRPAVAVLDEPGELAAHLAPGVPLALLHKRPGLDFSLVGGLRRFMRQHQVDVVHAHNPGAAFYAGLAARLERRPMVTTLHGANFEGDRTLRMLTRLSARMGRYLVCVGQEARATAQASEKVPARRLRVIHNGVDLVRFAPDPAARSRLRRSLGIADDQAVIISVGRLSFEKDCVTLFEALRLLAGLRRRPRLWLVGDGPQMPAYQEAVGQLGLDQVVRFWGNRQDVAELLGAADVFALSSLSEGISIAILEAMACGLPVVATAVGGNPELVQEGRSGLLVPPRSPQALASALARCLEDPPWSHGLGREGRALAQGRFSLQAMVEAYARLYHEVSHR
ncbi:MAG: glycosyltransferase [Desulfarculus sp.]|nr:glycosyltransferase [Desulfarculus sp.]